MIKERVSFLRRLTIATDIVIVAFAFVLGYALNDSLPLKSLFANDDSSIVWMYNYSAIAPVFVMVWAIMLYTFKMYESFRTKKLYVVYWSVIKAGFASLVIVSSVMYVFRLHSISRSLLFGAFVFAAGLLMAEKTALIIFFRFIRRKGFNYRQILVVGTNRRAQRFIDLVRSHPAWGYRIVGIIDDEQEKKGETVCGVKVLGTFSDLARVITCQIIDEIVFVVPRSWLNKIEDVMCLCEDQGLRIHLAVDYFDLKFSKSKLSELEGFPLLTFASTPLKIGQLFLKRIIDISVSGVLLLLFLPAFAVIAVVIKATSSGTVLFRQKRIGLNGRKFTLYKFRTMVKDAELKLEELRVHNEMTGPVFKMKHDPRVTRVGKTLRKFSLDELPQLWNVFKGDMSLVGPRPPLATEVREYDHWQRRRLSMRPGITCLWQVSGRNKIVDFSQWVKMDLEYIDNWSIWLDTRILFKTIPAVVFGIGAK